MSIRSLRNIKPKQVKIELDKPRIICFDFNAFSELEEKYETIENALKLLQEGKIKVLRTFLWAGLLFDDETITEKQVGALAGFANIEYIMEKVNESMSDSLPETEEKGTSPNAVAVAQK